jgi:hypothetical protein
MIFWLGITALGIYFMVTGIQEMQQRAAKKDINKRKAGKITTVAGVQELIDKERIDEAVDLYKAFTGVDEYTAREAIEAIQSRDVS